MRKRTVFYVLTIATILWVLFMFSILTSLGAENKPVSKSQKGHSHACASLYRKI